MAGLVADFFRLGWGLIYWNVRKSWFRWRRGRARCPCQSPSDSGRAFETGCDACLSWARPGRFRRICPLLVDTRHGLRCSADTADVRPFWGRPFLYYGSASLALYLTGVLLLFAVLRTVGYPVSVVHLAFPPLWHRVAEVRSWFFMDRAAQAFHAGRTAEGLLYLANAYEFDPGNYTAGLMLAKNLQAGQPARSDRVFEQLLREHPDKRSATAQDWYRALLARGSFDRIIPLAAGEFRRSHAHAGVWLRALFLATWQLGRTDELRDLLGETSPALRSWKVTLETELVLRTGDRPAILAALRAPLPPDSPPYALFHRIDALTRHSEVLAALDLLAQHTTRLDGDAQATLLLNAYATQRSRSLGQQFTALLAAPLTPPLVTTLTAHLIRHPNTALFDQLWQKLVQNPLALNTDTAGAWFSLLCAAGAVGDGERLAELSGRLKNASGTPFLALSAVEAFFRGQTAERRINRFLPVLPLPLDVTYALLERYSPPAPPPPTAAPRP